MTQPIKIAILAMGGEGGGVLADWLVDMAEHAGWIAQTTSVPGVAQRTGATIYYVELFPGDAARSAGQAPVLALMPLPGDVDVVLASELMEAGRAVQRGLVTPERTTLVTSTHRVYAIAEKVAMGDGRSDSGQLLVDVRAAAQRFVGFDMAATAEAQGSLVSAVLLGALAATRALPFETAQFEATIERGGVGVQASLRAFRAAVRQALDSPGEGVTVHAAAPAALPAAPAAAPLPRSASPDVQALIDRASQVSDPATRALVLEGLRRLVDYQDPAYAALYLDRLAAAPQAPVLQQALARHLALWMSYEDTVRVAELKTRGSRFERVRDEVRATDEQLLSISEYLHPRLQEIAETLPAAAGRWLLASSWPRRAVQRLGERGRVVRTSGLRGFLLLWTVSRLKRWRRGSLRFALEAARIEQWLADVRAAAAHSEAVALELVHNQRLVKGYGDTHARGLRSYARLRQAWLAGVDAAGIARLRDAALADEDGRQLDDTWRRMNLAPAHPATDLKDAPRMTALSLRVVAATMLNPLIRELRLAAPDGTPLPGFSAGAHVRVQVRLPDGTTDARPYSLIEFAADTGALAQPVAYRIAVRLEDPGRGGSRFMHQALQVGDVVNVEPPGNDFVLGAHAGTAVLVAGGIGVTPLTTMAAALRAANRPVRMVYAGRSRALMAYVTELQGLLGGDLQLHVDDEAGRTLDVGALLAACGPEDVLYVCGPGVMLEAVQREAAARGWPKERVRFEVFTAAAPMQGDPPFEVELALSGKRFTVPGDRTLLQVLIDHGCDPMFDCQRGECGVCAVPVMSGDIDHRDYVLTQREKDAGNVIQACVSRARGTLVLDL